MLFRILLVPLLLLACASPPPFAPAGAVAFTPPPVYRTWWAEVEACSGLRGDFTAVRWQRVPEDQALRTEDGTPVAGLWQQRGNSVTLQAPFDGYPRVPKHEMLHALLRRPGHPPEYFVDRCGQEVA